MATLESSLAEQVFIQSFGHTVVSTLELRIVAISSNLSVLTGDSNCYNVGGCLEDFISSCFSDSAQEIQGAIHEIINFHSPRKLILHEIRGITYYINIYVFEQRLYMEWEEQLNKAVQASEMNEIGFLFEQNHYDIWGALCISIHQLIGFDRVAILQIHETGKSNIISEACASTLPTLLGKRFAETFMPAQALRSYTERAYMYTPDIYLREQILATTEEIDLAPSLFRKLPDVHRHYMEEMGAAAGLFFRIIIEGQFWGLVVAHNVTPKRVDLQKRKLCSFIVQMAASKEEGHGKRRLLQYQSKIEDIEQILKANLLESKTIHSGLSRNIQQLNQILHADGTVIYFQGDISSCGVEITDKQIEEVVTLFKKQPKRPLWKDCNFREKHGEKISENLPFAGLLVLQLDDDDDHFILWLRKETLTSELQFTRASAQYTDVRKEGKYSGSTYEIWEKMIFDCAVPWDANDISYALRLHKLVNEIVIARARTQERIQNELISVNNELEMLNFTLSHDLKNPLAMIKMGAQYMDKTGGITEDLLKKWCKNILKGVDDIENLLNCALNLSQTHVYQYAKESIPVAPIIRALCRDAKLLYNSPNCEFYFGKLNPICGEKGILYQVFLNLIGNAVKYSSSASFPVISIESEQDNEFVRYYIEDNGIGIPDEQLPHIFDIFVRATNVSHHDGTGIGLGLVKRIMGRLGGHISIESKVEIGTKVTLLFPVNCP